MSLLAVALVLASAGIHALWNLRLHGSDDRAAVMAVAGLSTAVVLSPWVVLDPPGRVLGLAALSGLAHAAYASSLAAAYRRGELSITYPIGRGMAPVFATAGAALAFRELPAPAAALGAVAMFAGLAILGSEAHRANALEAVGFAMLVALSIAAYSVIDAEAVERASPPAYLAVGQAIQGTILVASVRFDPARLRAAARDGIRVGLGSLSAYLLVLFAFRLAPVGRVATLREVSVVLALVFGAERLSARRWVGASLCCTAAILAAA